MKKILITGGSGALGAAFIKEFYSLYHFVSYSQNKEKQIALQRAFNKIELYNGSIEDYSTLLNAFQKIKPDIVIHAAALKQVEISQKKPIQAIKTNLIGSLNVIEASRIANVPITIGVSSDKACLSNSVYGHTKNLMEHIFLESDNKKNRFLCCRLCNVAGSNGSVISRWLSLKKENKTLKITDPRMNRFMFLPRDAAHLLHKAIEVSEHYSNGYVLVKKVKSVNMYDLAQCISSDIEVVGKRPGEKLNETLISTNEVPFTHQDGDYVLIQSEKNSPKENKLSARLDSLDAEKMTINEMKDLIARASSELYL